MRMQKVGVMSLWFTFFIFDCHIFGQLIVTAYSYCPPKVSCAEEYEKVCLLALK